MVAILKKVAHRKSSRLFACMGYIFRLSHHDVLENCSQAKVSGCLTYSLNYKLNQHYFNVKLRIYGSINYHRKIREEVGEVVGR